MYCIVNITVTIVYLQIYQQCCMKGFPVAQRKTATIADYRKQALRLAQGNLRRERLARLKLWIRGWF